MKKLEKEKLNKIFSEFKENDMSSYNFLYKEYYSTVYGIVFPILKNKESAEDVAQEVFIKIYNMDRESFPKKGELSWLYTVSKNEAFGYLRKKKQEVNIDDIYEVSEESNEIENLIDVHTYNKIISGLNEQEKQIVSLKILSNFTFKKIGQMLSMPTPTVQWKYYKAIDSLKISLGNFAAFLFIFSILMVRRKVKNKNVKLFGKSGEKQEDTTFQEEEQSSSSSKNYSENTEMESSTSNQILTDTSENFINKDTINNLTQGTVQNVSEVQGKTDIAEPILISFCGIFLIFSIIFAIFFKKHQQKRNKKASK